MHNKYIALTIAIIFIIICISILLFRYAASRTYVEPENLEDLETQVTDTNEKNVKFDAYFKNPDKIHTLASGMDEKTNLYIYLKVDSGYLKNAKIEIKGENEQDVNFTIIKSQINSPEIEKIENNTINLNQIDKSSEIELEIPIESTKEENFDLGYFALLDKINFSGIYVNKKGKEKNVYKEIKIKKEWTQVAEAELHQKIEKYIPYKFNEATGILVQEVIKSNLKNNVLPIKQTQINVQVPTIEGINPTEVRVKSNKTIATNGNKDGTQFNENNWVYNKTTQQISITVDNKVDKNNKIKWSQEGADEYVITYIFPEELYSKIKDTGTSITLQADSIIHSYNNNLTEFKQSSKESVQLKNTLGNIIDANIEPEEVINKGFINENTSYKTEYQTNIQLNIDNSKPINKISLTPVDKFITIDNQIVNIENNMMYKAIKINKGNFDKILGKDGYIKIYSANELQATINKDTEIKDDEVYTINLEEKNLSNIYIETSKPQEAGRLIINIDKYIKEVINYTKEQIKSFSNIQTDIQVDAISEQNEPIATITTTSNIKLQDTLTKAELEINNNKLSTELKNEIELKAILRKDSNKFDLYRNPVLEIEMPEDVVSVKIKDIKMLYEDELKIKAQEIITNDLNHKVIKVTFEGEQTKYDIGLITKGTNIILKLDIITKELTQNKTDKIIMTYKNEKGTNYDTDGRIEQEIVYDAPVGINIENIPQIKVKSYSSVNSGEDIYEKQIITYRVEVTNVSLKDLENVIIKSYIPEGTTCIEYETEPDNENFMKFVKKKDVKEKEWKVDSLHVGESVVKEFEVAVNENSRQIQIENQFKVILKNKEIATDKIINNVKKAKISAELRAEGLKVTLEKSSKIKYVLSVKNLTQDTINNINIMENIPKGMKYKDIQGKLYKTGGDSEFKQLNLNTKYDEEDNKLDCRINSLNNNEYIVITITLEVSESIDKTIDNQVIVKVDDINYKSNLVSSIIEQPKFIYSMESSTSKEITEGDTIEYIIKIKNQSNNNMIYAEIEDILPSSVVPIDVQYGIENEETTQLINVDNTIKISQLLQKSETILIKIKVKANALKDKNKIEITNYANIKINDNILVKTKEISHTIKKSKNANNDSESNKITGIIWIDENKNGQRDAEEKTIGKIPVKVVDSKNGEILNNTTSNMNGEYEFDNIKEGTYIIVFDYNDKDYYTTEYKKKGIIDLLNSSAIDSKIKDNSEIINKALSDKITLEKNNKLNINLGLIERNKFDLRLDTYVSKVIVQDNRRIKEYNYNKYTKIARITIPYRNINDIKLNIEYKVIVKNEGDTPGYAKNILVYLPDELQFNKELNKDWNMQNDKKVCTSALINDIINVGESKEITLMLSKNIKESNIGIINNKIEIAEDYNERAILDYDSTAGNKKQTEDDISSADIIITIWKNERIIYIEIILVIMAVICIYVKKYIICKAEIKEGSESK